MKFTDRIRAFFAPEQTSDFAATGRPRLIEGEDMVLGNDLLATMTRDRDGGIYFLEPDDIIKRKGWSVYKEMLHDDQIKACLEFKKILVTGRQWELKPYDESPEAKLQMEFVLENFCRVDIDKKLHAACSALDFGFSIAEIVWTRDTWDQDGNQYVFLQKLAHRDPQQMEIKADVHGNVQGYRQINGLVGGYTEIDASKGWLFTHGGRFGNNYGLSDLRSAYRPWWAKKFIIQFWNVFLERMGAPMTTIKYPQGASDDLKNTLKKTLRNLSSKTEILIPEGVEITLVEATRGGQASYEQALDFHNNSIARALLMVGVYGANGENPRQSQGNSQGAIQLHLMFKVADTISQALTKSLFEQVVKQLLTLNFPKPLMPSFVWQDYGQFEGALVADQIRQMHVAGIVDLDQRDVNYLRSITGLPLRGPEDPEDEVLRPEPVPLSGGGAPPPPAGQGNNRAGDAGGAPKAADKT